MAHTTALTGAARSLRSIAWLPLLACLSSVSPAQCESVLRDYSDAQQVAIVSGSVGVLVLGDFIKSRHDQPVIGNGYQPNALDAWVRRQLHRGTGVTSNFLDNQLGSALTPMLAVSGLTAMDIKREEFGRDIPFFLAGLAATKGITDITKHLVGRPRPYCIHGGCPPPQLDHDDPFHQGSFFSGHASSAFFSATFFNKRFRRHMRQNWTRDEYRTGRILSPVIAFGWASVVGLSRIQSDKHFFSDVAVGAIVGSLMGELYYYLAYETTGTNPVSNTPSSRTPMFLFSVPIN